MIGPIRPNRLTNVTFGSEVRDPGRRLSRAFGRLRRRRGFVCAGECFIRAPVVSGISGAPRSGRRRGDEVGIWKSGRDVHGRGDHDFHLRLQ